MKAHLKMLGLSGVIVIGTIVVTVLSVAAIACFSQWRVDVNVARQAVVAHDQ